MESVSECLLLQIFLYLDTKSISSLSHVSLLFQKITSSIKSSVFERNVRVLDPSWTDFECIYLNMLWKDITCLTPSSCKKNMMMARVKHIHQTIALPKVPYWLQHENNNTAWKCASQTWFEQDFQWQIVLHVNQETTGIYIKGCPATRNFTETYTIPVRIVLTLLHPWSKGASHNKECVFLHTFSSSSKVVGYETFLPTGLIMDNTRGFCHKESLHFSVQIFTFLEDPISKSLVLNDGHLWKHHDVFCTNTQETLLLHLANQVLNQVDKSFIMQMLVHAFERYAEKSMTKMMNWIQGRHIGKHCMDCNEQHIQGFLSTCTECEKHVCEACDAARVDSMMMEVESTTSGCDHVWKQKAPMFYQVDGCNLSLL